MNRNTHTEPSAPWQDLQHLLRLAAAALLTLLALGAAGVLLAA